MLKIINNLTLFFEGCYRQVTVREYARIMNISPPTASKKLFQYKKEGLLLCEEVRGALLYSANRESKDFKDLSHIYWRNKLAPLTQHLIQTFVTPTIILYGSLAKAETTTHSDIDIALIATKKDMDLSMFEKKLGRPIQLLIFQSPSEIPRELTQNILNGYVLAGRLWIGYNVAKNK